MAEAMLRDGLEHDPQLRGEGIEVRSAGTSGWAGSPATDLAIEEMERRGLDLRGHRGRHLTRELAEWARIILTMEARQRAWILRFYPNVAAKTFLLAEYAGSSGDIEDPYGGDETEYSRCADRLASLVPQLVARLRADRA